MEARVDEDEALDAERREITELLLRFCRHGGVEHDGGAGALAGQEQPREVDGVGGEPRIKKQITCRSMAVDA
jgi:hypothetical protein